MNIKQLQKKFEKKFDWLFDGPVWFGCTALKGEIFSLNIEMTKKEMLDFLERALKETQKETIKEMLVEERVTSSAFVNHRENILFNQCCAIGRENEKKILKNL